MIEVVVEVEKEDDEERIGREEAKITLDLKIFFKKEEI